MSNREEAGGRTLPKELGGAREKLTVARVEYGTTPGDIHVILSNGAELALLERVAPHSCGWGDLPRVTLTAVLEGADDA